MKTLYNKDRIIKIVRFEVSPSSGFTFYPEKEVSYFFGLNKRIRKAYIYTMFEKYTIEEFERGFGERYFIKEEEIYVYPRIEIWIGPNQFDRKHFKTVEEMDAYIESLDLQNFING